MAKKKLSPKQKLWLKSYLVCLNATQAAKEAGYKCKSEHAFQVVGSENLSKLEPYLQKWLVDEGLTEERVKAKIVAGMSAKETKFFAFQGQVVETVEVESLETQRRYVDMAAKVLGIYAPTQVNIADLDKSIERLVSGLEGMAGSSETGTEEKA